MYEAPAAIALPAGDGQKTIYIQYLAKNGMDMSLVATDKVILDTTPPTVSAGTMGTLTQSAPTRTTNAKAEDVSGITKWNWTGPAAITFGSPNALNTTISASADGTYVVTLTVTDGVLHTNSADLTVKRDATPPNVPVFNAITTPAVTPTWTWASGGGGIGTYLVQLWTPKEEVRWEERLRSASFPVNKDHLADLMKARIYPLSDGKWTLKVAEYDDVGNLSNFAEQDVVVVPALPLDGAMVNLALPIHFEWRPMTNGYRIFYATAATNPKFALLGTTEAINYIDIPAKTLGLGTYYWYVQGTTFLPAGAPKTYFTVIVK